MAISVILALVFAVAGFAAGWFLARLVRDTPLALIAAVFLSMTVGSGAFVFAFVIGQRDVAMSLLGGTVGLLIGLKWGIAEGFGLGDAGTGEGGKAPGP